jgi:hypothetical protein
MVAHRKLLAFMVADDDVDVVVEEQSPQLHLLDVLVLHVSRGLCEQTHRAHGHGLCRLSDLAANREAQTIEGLPG